MRMAQDVRLRRMIESKSVSHEVVRRYVAGESITAALDATGELLVRGRRVSLTHLASDPLDAAEAKARRKRVRKVLRRLAQAGYAEGGRAEVSVRLRTLGAGLGPEGPQLAYEHAARICETAAEADTRVILETENTLPVDVTFDVLRRLRADFDGVGVAVRSSLRRTEVDCRRLADEGVRVRLSRGTASGAGAYQRPREVDLGFVRCLKTLVAGGGPVVVATHDPRLFAIAEALLTRGGEADLEYQLRYGVARRTQTDVADRGDVMRVYVPFGEDWYQYLMSRIAEEDNPVLSLARAALAR